MFEPKRKWFYEIDWEDRTVLLKGILSIKEEDYGRFTELALGAGMVEALAEEVGDWTFPEEDDTRPRIFAPFIPSHRGVPRQVHPPASRLEDRQASRHHHREARWRLLDSQGLREPRFLRSLVPTRALVGMPEGHRKTGGPSLIC